jgi:GNAT superfamily N-acetyltransferase
MNDMNEQDYEISTDKTRLDLEMIHDFLANRSYWSAGVPFSVVEKSIENSLCFGVYDKGRQVGFGRVVTDFATIAYVGDIFILEHYRGRGWGKSLSKPLWIILNCKACVCGYSEQKTLMIFIGNTVSRKWRRRRS